MARGGRYKTGSHVCVPRSPARRSPQLNSRSPLPSTPARRSPLQSPVPEMSRKIGRIPCSIKKFVDVIDFLGDARKTRIKELGFGGMLEIQEVKLRESLLNCILQCYDPQADKVIFGSGDSFSVYPYDVDIIMGLQDKGDYVLVDEDITLQDVPDKFKVRCTMEGMWIDDMVKIFDSQDPIDEDFDKSFVLFLVATILAPVSTDRFPISYYSLVRDASRIKDMNWNNFTLRFLKNSIATVKEDNSNTWPMGNLALLQYTYWEKIRPWESHFYFSGRTSPLAKYWDEDQACKREIYEISFGRPVAMVVDDLSKEPTTDEMLRRGRNQFQMGTPISMIDGSNKLEDVTSRLNSLEKVMAGVVEKDPSLVRCLEGEYGRTPERHYPVVHEAEHERKKTTSSRNEKKRRNKY